MERILKTFSFTELKHIASRMNIPLRRSKTQLITDIIVYSNNDKYKKEKQIGHPGKEGITYLVSDKKGKKYAMKTFRKTKASSTLLKECKLQQQAYKKGVAPKVYDYDTENKWIVMELMDHHLFEEKIVLTKGQQYEIMNLFVRLDKARVFHGDVNLANYMIKKGKIRLIDYGFSKEIDSNLIKKHGENPNYRMMTIGLVLKLKENQCPEKGFKYFLKQIKDDDKKKYNL